MKKKEKEKKNKRFTNWHRNNEHFIVTFYYLNETDKSKTWINQINLKKKKKIIIVKANKQTNKQTEKSKNIKSNFK